MAEALGHACRRSIKRGAVFLPPLAGDWRLSGGRMRRILLRVLSVLVLAGVGIYLFNASWLAPSPTGKPQLIAHRGLGQAFSRAGLTGETCTAAQMLPPEHPYLENTIASFAAAFDAGADVVEFDVHPTTDGHFVVFHDWTVDCRTESKGVTREHTLAALKALDIGFGYTADGGKTFPFRGKGIGLMPTLDEVLAAFPNERFLINIKSNDENEGRLLAARLAALPQEQRQLISVYGGGKAIDAFHAALPGATVLGTDAVKQCLIRYELLGWLGIVPAQCRNTFFMLPVDYAPLIWGYPNRLAARLRAHGTSVVLLGAYDGSGFSSGVDTAGELATLPTRFDGYVWTNRIDRIGPAVGAR
jgi:glycerophosphoryl diester phosphodiesterase